MKYIEDITHELKSELNDNVIKEVIAFLNSKGGTIYIGVNDDGSINLNYTNNIVVDDVYTKLPNMLADNIYPSCYSLIDFHFNNDNVLIINVKEGTKKPYFLSSKGPRPSGVYKRVGSTTRKASEDEILQMVLSSNKYMYEDEVSEEQELNFTYLGKVFSDKNIELSEHNFYSFGLKNKDDYYTNLAYLLSDESNITIKIAEYDENLNFKLKKEFTGSLIKLFYLTKEQLDRMNDKKAIINLKTFSRIETLSYPEIAIREVLLNAFCHADYFIRSNIKIEFFADHLKITNPGGVYNATLADVLRVFKHIETLI